MSVLSSPQYVSQGDQMVWSGQFGNLVDIIANKGPAQIIADITTALLNTYDLTVVKYDNGVGSTGLTAGTVNLYLLTNSDRGDGETDDGLTDILNNVNSAFTTDGHPPSAAYITSYTPVPDSTTGTPQPTVTIATPATTTAAAAMAAAAPSASSSSSSSILGSLGLGNVVGNLESGGIGLIIGAAAVVAILIYMAVKP